MTDLTGPSVLVEVIALRAVDPATDPADTTDGPHLAYRWRTATLCPPDTPDSLARRLARLVETTTDTVLHSTSWRYQPTGELVLTYLVCPDPEPAIEVVPLPDLQLAYAAGPAHPTPPALHLGHVASHAARHLAWLGHTDPVVAATLSAQPRLLAALQPLAPSTAGLVIAASTVQASHPPELLQINGK
jgi:hypothetical protein